MVILKSEHADKYWLSSVCRCWAEWATSAASSANSRSCKVIFFNFDFTFSRAGLNRSLSDLVCNLTHIVDKQKAHFSSIEKKIPKRVGATTQPCFTPLLMVNKSEKLPSYWTVAFVFMWKDLMMFKRLGEQPIFNNIANSPSLLARLKALVRSMKGIYKSMFCSLYFSCSCCTEKIMSVMELWDLNPHYNSGNTLLNNFCRQEMITCASFLPAMPFGETPCVVIADLTLLFSYKVIILQQVLWYHTFPPTFTKMSCRRGTTQDLHWQNKSTGMTSLPGAFQKAISVKALLISLIIGLLSRSSLAGS